MKRGTTLSIVVGAVIAGAFLVGAGCGGPYKGKAERPPKVKKTKEPEDVVVPVAAPDSAAGLFPSLGERLYLVLGTVVGLSVGPAQAASRSLLTRIAPPDRITQHFGLLALSGRVTSFVGTLVVGVLTTIYGSQRIGISVVVVFFLAGAALLGVVFLWIKWQEYAGKAAAGIDFETHAFFTFYYLLTGFHAVHVVAGIVILALVGWNAAPRTVETGAAFWHMVDLVWVLLFPILYLLR